MTSMFPGRRWEVHTCSLLAVTETGEPETLGFQAGCRPSSLRNSERNFLDRVHALGSLGSMH